MDIRPYAAVLTLTLTLGTAVFAQEAEDENDAWRSEIERKLAEPVSINFQQVTLSKALEFFRTNSKLNIVLDSKSTAMGEKKFTLNLRTKVRTESGIAWTARLMGLEYVVMNEAVYLAERDNIPVDWRSKMQERYRSRVTSGQEAWIADMEAKLDRKIKVNFRNDPLPVALGFLGTAADLNIVIDGHLAEAANPVMLEVEMTVKNVLNWVTRQTGVKVAIRDEVIYVADLDHLEALRLETGESPLSMPFRRSVTFRFKDTPVEEAMERLSRHTNVTIKLQGVTPDDKVLVTGSGDRVELNHALRTVLNSTNRPYAISYTGHTVLVVLSAKSSKKPDEKKN